MTSIDSPLNRFVDHFWVMYPPALIGAWVTLVLVRRFRIERGWIDWSGMALGALWISLFLYQTIAVPFLARLY